MLRARSHFDWLDSPLGLVANSSLYSRHQALLSEEKVDLSPQVVRPHNLQLLFIREDSLYRENAHGGREAYVKIQHQSRCELLQLQKRDVLSKTDASSRTKLWGIC